MTDRTGRQKTREQRMKRRVPELGYYFIVTDTKETEQNYILGLRDSFPAHIQGKLVIKVWKARTVDLVEKALEMASLHPQFGEPWIIFDRDQVPNFDAIITAAQQQGIHVGWSNPCIEIWFHTYFGSMPTHQESVSCCAGFSKKYKHIVDQTYEKADRSIYEKLCKFGNENTAISIAETKYAEYKNQCITLPSKMCPCTTVHILVKELKGKVSQ